MPEKKPVKLVVLYNWPEKEKVGRNTRIGLKTVCCIKASPNRPLLRVVSLHRLTNARWGQWVNQKLDGR